MAAVLLIEDDPHQRAFAALVLAQAGHTVREATDGQQGLQLAREQAPELIVCDVVMPGMNGYQLVAAVRKEPTICTTPVILLTSLAERAQVRVGMNAGADDYLPKPFRPSELVEAAEALLRRRRTQYEAIAGSLMEDMDAALAHQREQLASRYETQLLQELNSKWKVDVEAGQEIVFDNAVVLVADLFSLLERESAGRPDAAELLQRAHQAASDALYLFGAVHVLPHGQAILAVYRADTQGRSSLANPLRSAFGLQTAIANVLAATTGASGAALAIGMDTGPAGLVRLRDPLHGDAGIAPVPGPTIQRAQALQALARAQGWQLAVTAAVAGELPPNLGDPGRTALLSETEGTAVELRRPRS
ncbi:MULTISPECIES: response regulator [Ramlibacter]|uniref:Response regulator n=1 Tax=Ramlibacter pinisoli TaxID=2682844 RepID=A0A6N8IZ98_9BURK|nr:MULTISPECIES: response regulator [Ramlibacter]MBA2962225.1 response regulator [Ramlibacter sp. CGMCC 1.13660]MVQ32167.1 response regulator [Ramlibacter pinisoli]